MTKENISIENISITYKDGIFCCTKDNAKWISLDGEKWYCEEKRVKELEETIFRLKCRINTIRYIW